MNNIEASWLGHASVFISYEDKNIYLDPYKISPSWNEKKADLILITHSHYDHCSVEDLRKICKDGTIIVCATDCPSLLAKITEKLDVKIVSPGQEVDLDLNGRKIRVQTVPAYNVGKEFHNKHEYWNGYILDLNGTKIYHAGDTDLIPEMNEIGENEKIDIAFLPVGGTYTMTAEEAVRAAVLIRPKLAIPIHYGDVVGGTEDALRFQELCKNEGINSEILKKE